MAEEARQDDLCWEVAGGTMTAHLVAQGQPHRKSGPRALCGAYPQRNYHPWFSLSTNEFPALKGSLPYSLSRCDECVSRFSSVQEDTDAT